MRRRSRSRRCRAANSAYDPQMLTEAARAPARSRIAGTAAFAGAALTMAFHVWLGRGVFVPIRLSGSVEYVLVSATAAAFTAILLSVGGALAASHLLVRRIGAGNGVRAPLLSWADVSYMRPLWCFAA